MDDLWETVFTEEQLEIIESVIPENTLDNHKLLLKLVMGKLWKELFEERSGRDASSDSIKLIDIARRINEDIAALQGGSEGDPENVLDKRLEEMKERQYKLAEMETQEEEKG